MHNLKKAITLITLGLFLTSCEITGTVDNKMVGEYILEDSLLRKVPILTIINTLNLRKDGTFIGYYFGPGHWKRKGNKIIIIPRFAPYSVLKIESGGERLIEFDRETERKRVFVRIPPFVYKDFETRKLDYEMFSLWAKNYNSKK